MIEVFFIHCNNTALIAVIVDKLPCIAAIFDDGAVSSQYTSDALF